MISFVIGMFVGVTVGVLGVALCMARRNADESLEACSWVDEAEVYTGDTGSTSIGRARGGAVGTMAASAGG